VLLLKKINKNSLVSLNPKILNLIHNFWLNPLGLQQLFRNKFTCLVLALE